MKHRPTNDEGNPTNSTLLSSASPARRSGLDPDRPRPAADTLTTLEWLLITAAVAGLAALAVVLVQAYVEDTGDRIANPNPRVTSAIHSAFEVETRAKAASAADFDLWADWERHFRERCSLIAVLYADAEVEVINNNFIRATGGTTFDVVAAGYAALADEQQPTTGKAQVQCSVR